MKKHIIILLLITTGFLPFISSAQELGIINNSNSPYVRLKSINIGECEWTDGFWADKFKLCEDVMVPHMGTLLKGDVGHAYNNFKIVAGLMEGEHGGTNWHDGDFYKWMESAMYVYGVNKDPEILKELDEIIEVIGQAQADDGYIHTRIQIEGIERYSKVNYHELYNSGHLLTAACIHNRVSGQRNFLDIAIKHADFLYKTFQPKPAKLARFAFNPTQITGLVELYRTTKEKRYLELAGIFVDMRGNNRNDGLDATSPFASGDMCQDRVPFRKETSAEGHAVLAMYLYAGAADVYAETGEKALKDALDRIWHNVVDKKMYITGAVGQTHHGGSSRVNFVHEAFVDEYMMPNLTAYNETCANICNAMFNWRMLGITEDSKYGDIMELVLYNSSISGISEDGKHYFYTNPLRRTLDHEMDTTDQQTREPYLDCFCCPPNLVRTIAKLSGWAYGLVEDGIAVNLYGGNHLNTHLQDGSTIQLSQKTDYPWNGDIEIKIETCKATPFALKLRIPAWAEGALIKVNGKHTSVDVVGGKYAVVKRKWKGGDVVSLTLPMETRLLVGHPRIEEVRNQAAVQRGPVVFCMESNDLPENTSIMDVYIPSSISLEPKYQKDLIGGLTILKGNVLLKQEQTSAMYNTLQKPQWKTHQTQFIPYYAWSNRGVSEMSVWLPIVWQ